MTVKFSKRKNCDSSTWDKIVYILLRYNVRSFCTTLGRCILLCVNVRSRTTSSSKGNIGRRDKNNKLIINQFNIRGRPSSGDGQTGRLVVMTKTGWTSSAEHRSRYYTLPSPHAPEKHPNERLSRYYYLLYLS